MHLRMSYHYKSSIDATVSSMTLSVGSPFPKGVKFVYCPYDEDVAKGGQCPAPLPLNLDKFLGDGKTFVIVAVPGAFTPTCSEKHIPAFVKDAKKIKEKADAVIVLSANDPFVQYGWALSLDGYNKDLIFASDPNSEWTKSEDLAQDLTSKGLGWRTKRFALIVKNGKVSYLGVEPAGDVGVSSADSVLKNL